jgi:hypothetical protein
MAYQDNKLFYLAAPYSHDNPLVVQERMDIFARCETALMIQNIATVSPLAKHYTVVQRGAGTDWQFWENYSRILLKRCDHLIILTMPGWYKSKGVRGELDFARDNRIPYSFVKPTELMADIPVEAILFIDSMRSPKHPD